MISFLAPYMARLFGIPVGDQSVNQENICSLNTVIMMCIVARRNGEFDSLIKVHWLFQMVIVFVVAAAVVVVVVVVAAAAAVASVVVVIGSHTTAGAFT
jgi:hypothetical protein